MNSIRAPVSLLLTVIPTVLCGASASVTSPGLPPCAYISERSLVYPSSEAEVGAEGVRCWQVYAPGTVLFTLGPHDLQGSIDVAVGDAVYSVNTTSPQLRLTEVPQFLSISSDGGQFVLSWRLGEGEFPVVPEPPTGCESLTGSDLSFTASEGCWEVAAMGRIVFTLYAISDADVSIIGADGLTKAGHLAIHKSVIVVSLWGSLFIQISGNKGHTLKLGWEEVTPVPVVPISLAPPAKENCENVTTNAVHYSGSTPVALCWGFSVDSEVATFVLSADNLGADTLLQISCGDTTSTLMHAVGRKTYLFCKDVVYIQLSSMTLQEESFALQWVLRGATFAPDAVTAVPDERVTEVPGGGSVEGEEEGGGALMVVLLGAVGGVVLMVVVCAAALWVTKRQKEHTSAALEVLIETKRQRRIEEEERLAAELEELAS